MPWDKMTNEDWETLPAALCEKCDWEQMWWLAQIAPAMWSVRLLLRLKEAAWMPEQAAEQAAFTKLARLAGECSKEEADILEGEVIHHSKLKEPTGEVTCMAISPDGQILAGGVGEYRHETSLWQLPDGKVLKTLWNTPATCITISPDGQVLLSKKFCTIRLWSLPDGMVLQTLEGHSTTVTCVTISPDGQILASGERGFENFWDRALWEVGVQRGDISDYMIFSDNDVRLWCLPDGVALHKLAGHTDTVTCLAFSPDGRMLASGSWDKTVRLWSLPDGTTLRTLEGHTNELTDVVFSPDGQMLASGSRDKTVRLWSLPDGTALQTLEGHSDRVISVAFSPNGQVLASGSWDKTVRLWRSSDGATLQILEGHTDKITCLAISPNGQMLVSGSTDGTVRLWALWKVRLRHLISESTRLEHVKWVEDTLKDEKVTDAERKWLEFLQALMRWQRRFDVKVGEASRAISSGEFDIEIE